MQGHVVRLWMIILEMYAWSQIICFVSQLVFRSNGTTSKNTVNKNCFLLSSVLYTVTCNVLIYKSCYPFSRRNSTSPTSKCIDSPGFDRHWIWFPQLWTPNEAWYPIITSRTMIEQMLSPETKQCQKSIYRNDTLQFCCYQQCGRYAHQIN